MPDFSLEQPSTEASLERLHDAVNQLSDLVRDAVRKSTALETRIEALPGPHDIAVAVEAELERTVQDARDAIDARVGQLSGDLDTLEHRLTEIGDALIPLEGLRTEIATVADQSGSFNEIRAAITDAVGRIGSVAPSPSSPSPAVDTDELIAAVRGALDTTVASIRADFEVLVRAEQQEAEKRIDALGLRITNLSMSVSKALDDLVGHSARVDERAQVLEGENAAILESVRKEVASAVSAAGEEVRVRTEALGDALSARAASIESSMADRVASFEQSLAEKVASLQSNLVEQLRTLNTQLGAIPEDITTTLADINRAFSAVGDLSGVQATIEAAAEQLRTDQTRALEKIGSEQERLAAQLSERMADIAPSVASALADVREALGSSSRRTSDDVEGVRAEVARALAELRDAVTAGQRRTSGEISKVTEHMGSASQRTANVLEGFRSPLKRMADATGGVERARAELSAAIAALDEHLVRRTAGVKTSITEHTSRLESQIAALPRPDELASSIERQVGASLTDAQRRADEVADGLRQDMTGVASNVNEIWVRVRTMAKGLEDLKTASKEDAGTLIALIEEMAQSESRSAARLAEAERRFVGAVRQIEHERDKVFVETLNEFLERLPRRERNRLSKRMRALNFARRPKDEPAPEPPAEPLEPAAPVSSVEPLIMVEQLPPPKKPRPQKKVEPRARETRKARPQRPKKQTSAPPRVVEAKVSAKPRTQRAKRSDRAGTPSNAPDAPIESSSAPKGVEEAEKPS